MANPYTDDIVLGKAFDRRLMGRLLSYAMPYRAAMAKVVALIISVTGLGVAAPLLFKAAIDGPLHAAITGAPASGDSPRLELALLVGLFLLISLGLVGLRYLETLIMARIGQQVMLDLRAQVFSHIQRMPLAFFDRNPVGRLVTRITSDVEALNELFASGVVTFIADILVLVGITLTLLLVNVRLALVTLAVLPFLLAATFVFRAKARKYYREQRGHLAHLNAYTQEAIQGVGVLQLFHQEEASAREYRKINNAYLSAFQKTVLAYSIYFPVIEVLGTLALVAIIGVSATQIQSGQLTFGGFYLFWHFLGKFFQPIRDMAERYNILQSAMASAERIFTVLDTPEGMPVVPAPPPPSPPSPQPKVAFEGVWFAYKEEEFALKDATFEVRPGEMVAVVGATGAGKSTIINLLSRFYDPQRGVIRIDGVDVRSIEKRALRRRIGVVLQDVFLFSRSVRDNIRLGDSDIPAERVEECARLVNADRFIRRLPAAYDHKLGERAGTLSVGEKQLLAFARALAHDPEILVLDEATANVDTETEVLIQDALEHLFKGRTSIVIAHRLSTVRRADRILVLHKGELREAGTHAELLEKGGIYARLHELQYK